MGPGPTVYPKATAIRRHAKRGGLPSGLGCHATTTHWVAGPPNKRSCRDGGFVAARSETVNALAGFVQKKPDQPQVCRPTARKRCTAAGKTRPWPPVAPPLPTLERDAPSPRPAPGPAPASVAAPGPVRIERSRDQARPAPSVHESRARLDHPYSAPHCFVAIP